MRGETEPGETWGEKVAGAEAECRKSGGGADLGRGSRRFSQKVPW